MFTSWSSIPSSCCYLHVAMFPWREEPFLLVLRARWWRLWWPKSIKIWWAWGLGWTPGRSSFSGGEKSRAACLKGSATPPPQAGSSTTTPWGAVLLPANNLRNLDALVELATDICFVYGFFGLKDLWIMGDAWFPLEWENYLFFFFNTYICISLVWIVIIYAKWWIIYLFIFKLYCRRWKHKFSDLMILYKKRKSDICMLYN